MEPRPVQACNSRGIQQQVSRSRTYSASFNAAGSSSKEKELSEPAKTREETAEGFGGKKGGTPRPKQLVEPIYLATTAAARCVLSRAEIYSGICSVSQNKVIW
jgi:hypothetical protein